MTHDNAMDQLAPGETYGLLGRAGSLRGEGGDDR
jgi:hypothetical protein